LLQINVISVSSQLQHDYFNERRISHHCLTTGILRFKTNQSVHLAMEKLRVGEIVVQDVAVHVKVLQASSSHMNATDTEMKNEDITKSNS
jgi:hypothetical protein